MQYDGSLVDGFNVPLAITTSKDCKAPACYADSPCFLLVATPDRTLIPCNSQRYLPGQAPGQEQRRRSCRLQLQLHDCSGPFQFRVSHHRHAYTICADSFLAITEHAAPGNSALRTSALPLVLPTPILFLSRLAPTSTPTPTMRVARPLSGPALRLRISTTPSPSALRAARRSRSF